MWLLDFTDKCVRMCVTSIARVRLAWTRDPPSALCANKTPASWDTWHPRSNSITLLKYYTTKARAWHPTDAFICSVFVCVYVCVCPQALVCVYVCVCMCMCACALTHLYHCDIVLYVFTPHCCQLLDRPFTIHCLCLVSKCQRTYRSRSSDTP